jgi:hypothetical protein
MPRDPYIREKFTRLRITAKKVAAEYFERFPKDRYLTEIEGWRHLQSDNIEFTGGANSCDCRALVRNHKAKYGCGVRVLAARDGGALDSRSGNEAFLFAL